MRPGQRTTRRRSFTRLAIATLSAWRSDSSGQWRQRTAGLHTMTLVAVGAALFCALPGLGGKVSDPCGVAAQVVTGVGFLAGGGYFAPGVRRAWADHGCHALGDGRSRPLGWQRLRTAGGGGGRRHRCGQRLRSATRECHFADTSAGAENFTTAYVLRVTCAVPAQKSVRECIIGEVGKTSLTLLELNTSAGDNDSVEIVANLNKPGGTTESRKNTWQIAALSGVTSLARNRRACRMKPSGHCKVGRTLGVCC